MRNFTIILSLLLFAGTAVAQKSQEAPVFSTRSGAIDGYDPVAYFTSGQPAEGQPDITFEWKGATWHFASPENRDLFAENPEQYAPQFGGWCAYGWAQGYPARIDPDAWSIVDGKLYLNYNRKVQQKWEENREAYIEAAGRNYGEAMK